MTYRAEFSKDTRRQALKRSGGFCEAIGRVYGLNPGQRCNAKLSYGVEFDHYPIRAADGGSNELNNCVAVCKKCHRWKTAKIDIPQSAKAKRIEEKRLGINDAGQGFATNRTGPFRRRLNGTLEPR